MAGGGEGRESRVECGVPGTECRVLNTENCLRTNLAQFDRDEGGGHVAQVDGCQQLKESDAICTTGAETAGRCISRQVRRDREGPTSRELSTECPVPSNE